MNYTNFNLATVRPRSPQAENAEIKIIYNRGLTRNLFGHRGKRGKSDIGLTDKKGVQARHTDGG